ncbi:MAG TPA: DUF362 domain-containing protein [Bacteroidales bacterium]|nr:DUF362 domain-containing protein [Bacteroidales bacterium]
MSKTFSRRKFFNIVGISTALLAVRSLTSKIFSKSLSTPPPENPQQVKSPAKPSTNIADALKVPRSTISMPGLFPGKVVNVTNSKSVNGNIPSETEAYKMIAKAMSELTGESSLKKAWQMFVKPGEKIGLKVNPVAGRELATSHAVVKSVVKQLLSAGIKKEDIVIWDRRGPDLADCGFNNENYPGIRIAGTEVKDEKGSFYDGEGKLYGERNIDKDWYYFADVEENYDSETLPYMINTGKYSYYSKIVTKDVDKIINIPILKNAGASITNAMKNLAFGAISNTSRLHASLWHETCAEVCAFAPIRDKVVLNICDGLRGCFNGGPAANPQFICNYNLLLVSSDPVALDRIAYEIIADKRIAEGLQKNKSPQAYSFLKNASDLNLGVSEIEKISVRTITMG